MYTCNEYLQFWKLLETSNNLSALFILHTWSQTSVTLVIPKQNLFIRFPLSTADIITTRFYSFHSERRLTYQKNREHKIFQSHNTVYVSTIHKKQVYPYANKK